MTKDEVHRRIKELESELGVLRLTIKAMEYHVSHLKVEVDAACDIRLVHVKNSDEAVTA